MDELQLIFIQRKTDQSLLPPHTRQNTHKSSFLQRQKIRVQRQNWILKLLKSVKQFTSQNKKIMYQTIYKMMNNYRNLSEICNTEIDKNFTQTFINLFIQFFREEDQFSVSIKGIIRANNVKYMQIKLYIVQDLIKAFVEYQRMRFKKALSLHFNEIQQIRRIHPMRPLSPVKSQQLTNKNKILLIQNVDFVRTKIVQSLNDKYQKFINRFQGPSLQSKANQIYIQLLNINGTNAHIIRKFYTKCYGNKKNISYNYSNLYTKQQIQKMQQKINQDIQKNKQLIKTIPKGSYVSKAELKQFLRLKIEIQQNQNKILKDKKLRNTQINDWLALSLLKSGGQFNPLTLMTNVNQDQSITYTKFSDIYGMHIKNYLRQVLNQYIKKQKKQKKIYQKINDGNEISLNHSASLSLVTKPIKQFQNNYNKQFKNNSYKKFRKDLFLDSYGEKVKQLLCKPPLYYVKQQKNEDRAKTEKLLPQIKGNERNGRGHFKSESNYISDIYERLNESPYKRKNGSFIRLSQNKQQGQINTLQVLKKKTNVYKLNEIK